MMGGMTAQQVEPSDTVDHLRVRYVAALVDVQGAGDRTIDALIAARDARQIARIARNAAVRCSSWSR